MSVSKLDVSQDGFRLLTQRAPWDERRMLFEKLFAWFGNALVETKLRHAELFTQYVTGDALNGKITRGDNYNGYPYVLLDYPNHFSKESILAARNLIWIGNGFHCTLHVRGALVSNVLQNISTAPTRFQNVQAFIGEDEWVHHVVGTNWVSLDAMDKTLIELIRTRRWLKLGTTIDLHQPDTWNNALEKIYGHWVAALR